MGEYLQVASVQDLNIGEMKLVEAGDRLVILFRSSESEYCCIDDICTHDGGSLSDGKLNGREIECPRHGARFDLCSGKALCMPATQDTLSHQVKVDGDKVLVKINEE